VATPEWYLEDFSPGQTIELGSYEMTREEILDFAARYDPQPFHVDEERARQSSFGGLVASGWHTGAVAIRLWVDSVMTRSSGMGSQGLDRLRWLRPVRPGDVLTARATVLNVTQDWMRPDRGTVRSRTEVRNQYGDVVMTFTSRGLFGRRNGDGDA